MELWQQKYGDSATMLCCCVEGKRVAMRFGGRYCLNGFLEDDGPSFPAQLGCQGFVVLDADSRFVTLRTKAWNQYRDEAYQEVENHLAKLLLLRGGAWCCHHPRRDRGRARSNFHSLRSFFIAPP